MSEPGLLSAIPIWKPLRPTPPSSPAPTLARGTARGSPVLSVALLCAVACNQGEPAPPVPGIPVNCDAYDGPRIGSWRGVPYPEGVLIDSAGVTEKEFFLLGGDYCTPSRFARTWVGRMASMPMLGLDLRRPVRT